MKIENMWFKKKSSASYASSYFSYELYSFADGENEYNTILISFMSVETPLKFLLIHHLILVYGLLHYFIKTSIPIKFYVFEREGHISLRRWLHTFSWLKNIAYSNLTRCRASAAVDNIFCIQGEITQYIFLWQVHGLPYLIWNSHPVRLLVIFHGVSCRVSIVSVFSQILTLWKLF